MSKIKIHRQVLEMSDYLANPQSNVFFKEQLRLYAFSDTLPVEPQIVLQIQQELTKRDKLMALLEGELNFHGENSGYASHDLHAFAAKFPPQLPRAFIRGLTLPGERVLDPMMGSGTTIVEALIEGRKGIGLDLDPLALQLSRVKTMPVATDDLRQAGAEVISAANKLVSNGKTIERNLVERFDERTRDFIDYWFLPATQRELMALVLAIGNVREPVIRRFLELTFSSVIVTKSGGVSLARDLAHSRPHRVDKTPKNALNQFALRLRKNLASIAELKSNGVTATPLAGDARIMPFANGVIDLVVTSPPYANAIDYMRAHKFSLVWLGKSVEELSELRSEYIGSERVGDKSALQVELPRRAGIVIQQLAQLDAKKAVILHKYFAEMQSVLAEAYRVLRPDSVAVVVVGTSTMRGMDVQTHSCLADIGASVGFEVVGVSQRALDRNKRMMPARFGKKTDSTIEQRMHEEYVIGFYKSELRLCSAQENTNELV